MQVPMRFGFYAILTDPLLGYEYCTKILVEAGIAFVQLRMKERPGFDVLRIADRMREITRDSATRLIINDYPDIAHECGADGVHIGQDDGEYFGVRKTVGDEAIIGVSTHTHRQTEAACALSPGYIGVGPVFPTPTKSKPDPVIGIQGMKEMLGIARVPAVAIGGIDLSNLHQVLEAGAENFCMVRQFTQSENPKEVLKSISGIYRSYYPGS